MLRRPFGRALALALAAPAALAGAAQASSLPQRTFPALLAPAAAGENETSPALSGSGGVIALDVATGPAPAPADEIYTSDLLTGAGQLLSQAPGGLPANGASTQPTLSQSGAVVAFASTATDLLAAARSGQSQVYVSAGGRAPALVSATPQGGAGNGASSAPSVSANGQYVAFQSTATNLVAGGPSTAGLSGIYVRDLATSQTFLASVSGSGAAGNGASVTPSIDGNGQLVSFTSSASNLVSGDDNNVSDIFVRDLVRHTTTRVDVSGSGRQQNRAVPAPFSQVSAISADGRYVAFDTDATDLVPGESPQPRTLVFVRDRVRRRTSLVSLSIGDVEANNDSFAPRISATGRYVVFESFATNLAPGGGPDENEYVRDTQLGTTSVIDVDPQSHAPGGSATRQLLDQPAISDDGSLAAFATNAAHLTGASNGDTQVLLRELSPPATTLTGGLTVGADDPAASRFFCEVDNAIPFVCPRGRLHLPAEPAGEHTLLVRAGGPGMLYDPVGVTVRFRGRG